MHKARKVRALCTCHYGVDQGNLELQPVVHLTMLASKAAVTNKMQVRTSDFGTNLFELPTGTRRGAPSREAAPYQPHKSDMCLIFGSIAKNLRSPRP